MKISGSFYDVDDRHFYDVAIANSDAHGTESYDVVGDSENDGSGHVWWDSTPVVIEMKRGDVDSPIIETRASVNIVTDAVLTGLYSSRATDTTVGVSCDGHPLFRGYVEPRAYTQAFDNEVNGLTLNCIDGLTAMQYRRYRDVQSRGDYLLAMNSSRMVSLKSLLLECIESGCGPVSVWYDGSKVRADGSGLLLDDLMVNDSLYLGDDYQSVKTCYQVAEDLLKYLGLRALMTCGGVYVFSDESLGKEISWELISGPSGDASGGGVWEWSGGELSSEHLGGADGSVDVGEVFNQVQLTISPKTRESVVRSPLDSSGTVPATGGRVIYMTEYSAQGEGKRAGRAFWSLIARHEDINNYDGEKIWKDFVVRPMRNVYWSIGNGSGPGSTATDWGLQAADKGSGPYTLADRLGGELGALLVDVGAIDHKPGTGDTGKQASVGMTTQLVVSVNGNGSDDNPLPTEAEVQSRMPLASYTSGDATAVYSPTDDGVRNYLVFTGTIKLLPLMPANFRVEGVRRYTSADAFLDSGNALFSKDRYLAYEWWKDGRAEGSRANGWIPDTGEDFKIYGYNTIDGEDHVDKFDVLWCMLRIGDKVLTEDKSKSGELDAFSWVKYRTLEECGNDVDEYLTQTFTIGFDPKVGDYALGQSFSIGTNFDYTVNIDADEGMAIPLPAEDGLHGDMKLDILGIDMGPWEHYHKVRHKTMFRHSKWSTDVIPLMAHVRSVVIQNLSVKFYSDGENSGDDDDIVYVSRSLPGYVNRKELTGSMIHSGFTSWEVSQYNLNNKMLRSTVCDGDGNAVLNIKDANSGEIGKPEMLYVDSMWRRLCSPRVTLTQTVRHALVSPWGGFAAHVVGDSTMTVEEAKMSLSDGTCKLKLVER